MNSAGIAEERMKEERLSLIYEGKEIANMKMISENFTEGNISLSLL